MLFSLSWKTSCLVGQIKVAQNSFQHLDFAGSLQPLIIFDANNQVSKNYT